jgi:hypothetical protein
MRKSGRGYFFPALSNAKNRPLATIAPIVAIKSPVILARAATDYRYNAHVRRRACPELAARRPLCISRFSIPLLPSATHESTTYESA